MNVESCTSDPLVRGVARRAGVGPGSLVVDVGCGYGATARLLTQEFGARVTGITLSAKQHARAVAAGPERFILGDWLAVELEPGAFDAVVALESVEHMPDRLACFRRVRRVVAAQRVQQRRHVGARRRERGRADRRAQVELRRPPLRHRAVLYPS